MNNLSPDFVRDVLGETNDSVEDLDLKVKVNIVHFACMRTFVVVE